MVMSLPRPQRVANRQLRLTLIAAVLIGIVYGAVQITTDLMDEKQRVGIEVGEAVQSAEHAIGNALWNLNDNLAQSILEGVVGHPFICEGRIITTSNTELGHVQRPHDHETHALANILFFPIYQKAYEIHYVDDGSPVKVGFFVATIDPHTAFDQFIKRASVTFIGGVVKSILLAVVLYCIFMQIVTRPLVNLSSQIEDIDPVEDSNTRVTVPREHLNDELGSIAGAFNAQVTRVRDTIRRLEQTEAELARVNQSLESRVKERTRDLEREVEEKIVVQSKLQIAAEKADRLADVRGQFLANMSHELRTPLNAIIGFSSALLEPDLIKDQAARREYLGHVQGAGEQLLLLVNDILDLSRIDSGQLHIKMEMFDVNTLVRDIGDVLGPLIEKNENVFRFQRLESGANVFTDHDRLKQVLTNLIANSAKFTTSGEISVSIEKQSKPDAIAITIKDTGQGISPNELPHIFEPYTQGDAARSKSINGSGLGLMIVRSICVTMNWHVEVDSKLGEGTCFTLTIPTDNVQSHEQGIAVKSS